MHERGKPIGQNKPLRDARKVLGVVDSSFAMANALSVTRCGPMIGTAKPQFLLGFLVSLHVMTHSDFIAMAITKRHLSGA
jgi:hypothetical protein